MNLNEEIIEINKKIRKDIENKRREFKACSKYDDKDLFAELCFCILTPQSKALNAWSAIEKLKETDLLYTGTEEQIVEYLNVVRFKNTKAKRLVLLRKQFEDIKNEIKNHTDIFELRKYLVDNVNGMGLKEASHFLRNIGYGEHLAILDRHILRALVDLKVINEIPKTLSYNKYIEIEEKMRKYSESIAIDLYSMDMVLWYRQIGYIFK